MTDRPISMSLSEARLARDAIANERHATDISNPARAVALRELEYDLTAQIMNEDPLLRRHRWIRWPSRSSGHRDESLPVAASQEPAECSSSPLRSAGPAQPETVAP